jgi:transcriptional regulator with XRE-family HTH domain
VNRIRKARTDAAITQAELAEAAGIDRSRLSRIESGHRVYADEINRIADALGVDPADVWPGRATRHGR